MGYSGTNGLEQLKQLRNRKVARMNTLAGRRKQPAKDMMTLKTKIVSREVESADPSVLAAIAKQTRSERLSRIARRFSLTIVLGVALYWLLTRFM